jgi:hypothetical protein
MKNLRIFVTPPAVILAVLLFSTALYAQSGPSPWRGANAAIFGNQAVNTIAADGKGRWLAGGFSVIGYSDDGGITWTRANVSAVFGDNIYVNGIAADGRGHWVAVGSGLESGVVRYGYSPDNGVTWINSTPRFRSDRLYGIAGDGAGHWAAVGEGGVEHSTDGGSSWKRDAGPTSSEVSQSLASIATDGNGRWLVGFGRDYGKICYSTNGGVSWTAGNSSTVFKSMGIFGIATDRTGRWVAVGNLDIGVSSDYDSGIGYSTDGGATWEAANISTAFERRDSLRAIATDGRGRWVAGGSNGKAAYSTNGGAAWTATNASGVFGAGKYDGIRAIATDGKGRWVTVGEKGKIAYMDWR